MVDATRAGRASAEAPLFKGRDENGSTVEVRPAADGAFDVVIEGRVVSHETVPWDLDPDRFHPFRIYGHECTEVFDASGEAVEALRTFLGEEGAEPPWAFGQELVEDGLVTPEMALTARGRRRLFGHPEAAPSPAPVTHLVVTANGGQARFFLLEAPTEPGPGRAELVEVGHATDPRRRARDGDLLSETRPGLRREAGPTDPRTAVDGGGQRDRRVAGRHGVSDRRDHRRRVSEQRFAEETVREALHHFGQRRAGEVVLVASPEMLGELRKAMAPHLKGPHSFEVRELARDLTWMGTAAVHDALAAEDLLPAQERLSPLPPVGATRGLSLDGWRASR